MITRRRLVSLALVLSVMISLAATTILFQARTPSQAAGGRSCGIIQTGTGYSFEWLHTANGNIVASSGCIINLKGFNWPGLGFDNAIGSGTVQRVGSDITWFRQTFHMNVWRVFLNAVWWNEDVAVPDAEMNYRAWVQHVVQLMESNGNYVLLTKGPQFHEVPCGGSITYCPHQNQAALDLQRDPDNPVYQRQVTTGQYIDDAVKMWTSVAALYANDSAVLYDSWNEMHHITPQLWRQNTTMLIDTIRAQNPRSLVFFGGPNWENGINPLVKGEVPAFTESNLVYDFHVYNGYTGTFQGAPCQEPLNELWAKWPTNANTQVGYAQKHGAASFSEWGGCSDSEPYNTDIRSFALSHHILLTYYTKDMVYHLVGKNYQLNSNGTKVQADYAAIQ